MKDKAQLKAGAVLSCPAFHGGTIYTNANLTDDIAREYLEMFPERAILFAQLPAKAAKKGKKSQETAEKEEAAPAAAEAETAENE